MVEQRLYSPPQPASSDTLPHEAYLEHASSQSSPSGSVRASERRYSPPIFEHFDGRPHSWPLPALHQQVRPPEFDLILHSGFDKSYLRFLIRGGLTSPWDNYRTMTQLIISTDGLTITLGAKKPSQVLSSRTRRRQVTPASANGWLIKSGTRCGVDLSLRMDPKSQLKVFPCK